MKQKSLEQLEVGKMYYEVIVVHDGCEDSWIIGWYDNEQDAIAVARHEYARHMNQQYITEIRHAQAIMVDGDDEPWFDEGNYNLIEYRTKKEIVKELGVGYDNLDSCVENEGTADLIFTPNRHTKVIIKNADNQDDWDDPNNVDEAVDAATENDIEIKEV